MPSTTVDHMISITIFLAAILLFVNLFSQTIQTAIVYDQHRTTATKCSDLLDTMLLNPGSPNNWGYTTSMPVGFGLQDPEFIQYRLNPFSFMRLDAANGDTVKYDKTNSSIYYNNLTLGFWNFLVTPKFAALNYSTALKLLGINGTYGFQLTLTPAVTVSVAETQACTPLTLSVDAIGTGFPLANAVVSYCLILVTLPDSEAEYPSYTLRSGVVNTDQQGHAVAAFEEITNENQIYAFIAYAHIGGLLGVGYHERLSSPDQYVVPIVKDMSEQKVLIAHNYDLNNSGPAGFSLKYNTTFVILSKDYSLRELTLGFSGSSSMVGTLTSGIGNPYPEVELPFGTPGILIVTYQKNDSEGGIVMMPWGISSLAFPVTFGGDPQQQEWVATDIRQVMLNDVVYQAKLSLWSVSGTQVIG